jgi:hypothetical protein
MQEQRGRDGLVGVREQEHARDAIVTVGDFDVVSYPSRNVARCVDLG